jgi:hypothetical protein
MIQAEELKVMVLGPPCGKTTFLQHLPHSSKKITKSTGQHVVVMYSPMRLATLVVVSIV